VFPTFGRLVLLALFSGTHPYRESVCREGLAELLGRLAPLIAVALAADCSSP
jgi:hypothetical protein